MLLYDFLYGERSFTGILRGGIEDKSCLARCRIRKIPWDTVVELENLLKGQKYNESEN